MSEKDGGPAFARTLSDDERQAFVMRGNGPAPFAYEGMKLRDYLAAKAIPIAWETEKLFPTGTHSGASYTGVAQRCYFLADAMMKERKK